MSELHPVEMAWRRFRNDTRRLTVLQRCYQGMPRILDDLRVHGGITAWPPGVVLSLAVPGSMMKTIENWVSPEHQHEPTHPPHRTFAHTLHVWAAYRESKTIYQIEPALTDCLVRTPWPDDVPATALRLPSYCPILAFPWHGQTTYLAVTYDIALHPTTPEERTIHISRFTPPVPGVDPIELNGEALWEGICTVSLVRRTLAECLAYTVQIVNERFPDHTSVGFFHNDLAGFAITLLLYLAGEPDIVRLVHPGEKPVVKATLQKRDPERYKDLRAPVVHAVGTSFTQAIERWELEHTHEREEASGRTVRPHTRRAHAHLYWTGEGRSVPRVRFLLPISVKAGTLVEEPETPHLNRVR